MCQAENRPVLELESTQLHEVDAQPSSLKFKPYTLQPSEKFTVPNAYDATPRQISSGRWAPSSLAGWSSRVGSGAVSELAADPM